MPFDAGGPFGEDNSIKSIKALQSIDSRRRDPFLLDVSSAEQTGTDYCLINSETNSLQTLPLRLPSSKTALQSSNGSVSGLSLKNAN